MSIYIFHVTIPGFDNLWRRIAVRGDQALNAIHLGIQKAFDFDNDHLYSFYLSGQAWDRSTEYSIPEPESIDYRHLLSPEPVAYRRGFNPDNEMKRFLAQFMKNPTVKDVRWASELVAKYSDPRTMDFPDEVSLRRLFSNPEFKVGKSEMFINFMMFRNVWQEMEAALYRSLLSTTVESLNLRIGQSFLYLFDYGDEWHFNVLLWDIEDQRDKKKYPRVIAEEGDAPEQYAYYDEVDDWFFGYEEYEEDEEFEEDSSNGTSDTTIDADADTELEDDDMPGYLRKYYFPSSRPLVKPSASEKKEITASLDKFLTEKYAPKFKDNPQVHGVTSKWFRRFAYIRVAYDNNVEKNIVRLEFAGDNRFHLSHSDEKDNWQEDLQYVPLDWCFTYILQDEVYHP